MWTALLHRPAELKPLARYTIANGALYVAIGLVLLLSPTPLLELAAMGPLPGSESGLVRVTGMSVAVIGWFYVMGGRTGADSFGLATVVDRALVPFVLLPLAWSGAVAPALVVPIAVLDPLLAVGAYVVWRRQGGGGPG